MAKIIEDLKHCCNELLDSFKKENRKKALEWLAKLEENNNSELSIGKEFKIQYLLSLNGFIARQIENIKANIDNPKKCNSFVIVILEVLKKVVDQREVRDEIIKDTIYPIFKRWGYKKRERTFVKEEKGFFKKVSIYSSKSNSYYDVDFIFEIEIKGPQTNLFGKRIKERWFSLTQDTDLEKIRVEIIAHLEKEVKPFLEKF